MDQPALFDDPAPPPRRRPRLATGPAAPRYTRYRLVRRTLCDDCIAAIHVLGIAEAPYPKTVRWRRTHGTDVALLCDPHKEERLAADV